MDSYTNIAEADLYHGARPSYQAWAVLSDEEKQRALVSASDYLDAAYPLKNGLNAQMRQGLADIPDAVKKAVCELALRAGELNEARAQEKASVSVGSVSVTYRQSSGIEAQRFPYVARLLGALLASSNQSARMVRG